MQVYRDKNKITDANWIILHVKQGLNIRVADRILEDEDYLVLCDCPTNGMTLHTFDPEVFHRLFKPDGNLRKWKH